MIKTEVLVEAAKHRRQLTLLVSPLPMHMPFEPLLGFGQELTATFDARDSYQGKLAALIYTTDMRKTQEVKRVRFVAGLRQVRTHEAPKAHQPRLFLCQFQSEFLEAIG